MSYHIEDTCGTLVMDHVSPRVIAGKGYVLPSGTSLLTRYSHSVIERILLRYEKKKSFLFLRWFYGIPTPYLHQLASKVKSIDEEIWHFSGKISWTVQFESVTESSVFFSIALKHVASDEILVNSYGQAIYLDANTRKKTPVPLSLKNKINNRPKLGKNLPSRCLTRYDIPADAKTYTRTTLINASDLDIYGHLPASTYLDLCFNCLAEALSKQFFSTMSNTIWSHPVRNFSQLHLKETNDIGAPIDTFVWRDMTDQWLFHFHIMRGPDLLCQVDFELYPYGLPPVQSKI